MGAAHSAEPRSVSMENPTPAGVIDVSEEVVQRLKKSLSKQEKEDAASSKSSATPSAKAVPPKEEAPRAPPAKPVPAPAPVVPSQVPKVAYPSPPAIYIPHSGPTITASDVRRQMEAELQQNDTLWRQRMIQLEQTLNKTNAVLEKEYSAAVENVRQRFATASPTHQLPPCQGLKAQVIACYTANRGETLKCAEEVAAFRNCVSSHRVQKLDVEENSAKVPKAA